MTSMEPENASDGASAVGLGFTSGDLVVVTGAGSGIGQATARRAATVGLEVAAWDLNLETAEQVAAEITAAGGTASAAKVDVTVAAEVEAGFAGLGRPVRYLVNNAGPLSSTPREFNDGLITGVGSMELVARTWLGTEVPTGAALVNVASVAGNVIGAEPSWYSATKAGVAGYTRHLAVHQADRIRTNAVAPGMVATPRSKGFDGRPGLTAALSRNPLGRMAEANEIAWTILFLLSPLAGYVNGALLVVDGGWTVSA